MISSKNTVKIQKFYSLRIRNKVTCYCDKCKGKLIDSRMRNKYDEEKNQMKTQYLRIHSLKFSKANKSISRKTQIYDDNENLNILNLSKSSNSSKSASSMNLTDSSSSLNSLSSSEEIKSEQKMICVPAK